MNQQAMMNDTVDMNSFNKNTELLLTIQNMIT